MLKVKKIKSILFHSLVLFIILILILGMHIYEVYGTIDFKQILFHIEFPFKKNSGNFVTAGFYYVIPRFVAVIIIYFIVYYLYRKIDITVTFRKIKTFSLNIIIKKFRWVWVGLLFVTTLFIYNKYFLIFDTIENFIISTEIYENYYVNPREVKVTMPEKKRNLIYIYFESLETADLSEKNGGYRYQSITPEVEELAKENINFSHTNKLGGFYQVPGTTYTVAAMIGQTAGLPLIPSGKRNGNQQDLYHETLTNIYTLGEILEDNGYQNYFMMGSDRYFADRAGYLYAHGSYDVFDYNTAVIRKFIPTGYDIDWWGFEDKKLYEYAKIRLKEITKNDEPFNLSLLTVDTHPHGGYLDETCEVDESLTHYENVYKCGSKMLYDFIKWLQKQPFYKNTTVIISGDHLNMAKADIRDTMPDNYDPTVLNIIMNSPITTNCYKNRIMTTFDMFPTTLAALGVEIEGNRLGLGTNLFSCDNTIAEEIGLKYFSNELSKNSFYYKTCLLNGKCKKETIK